MLKNNEKGTETLEACKSSVAIPVGFILVFVTFSPLSTLMKIILILIISGLLYLDFAT